MTEGKNELLEDRVNKYGFINDAELEFTDISGEEYREYTFWREDEEIVLKINDPLFLNVSESGGHRIYTKNGMSHYIPSGWFHLQWKSNPSFVF